MPNAGIIRTTSSEVAANGIASVTQSVTANAMMARHALPLTVSGIRLPARSSGGGVGARRWRTAARWPQAGSALSDRAGRKDPLDSVARTQLPHTLEAETRAEFDRARGSRAGDDAEIGRTERVARYVEIGAVQEVVRLGTQIEFNAGMKRNALLDRRIERRERGPRNTERGELPKVKFAGLANAAVLNQRLSVR